MSSLRIIHQTKYHYHKPVRFGRHRLVIRPREGHDLRIETMEIAIRPNHELWWTRDIHGNSVGLVDFFEASNELSIESDVWVQRFPQDGLPRDDASGAVWPVAYDPLESALVEVYRTPIYPTDQLIVKKWLTAPEWSRAPTVEETVMALNRRISQEFTYARREQKGVFSPAQTIAGKRGSCRDLSTLLLEACRSLGLAGRFASGYLECAPAAQGDATTHAWTEVYLPAYGWRGYDPTSGLCTSTAHVVTGVSHHPRGVMPISGNYFGERTAFDRLEVSVRMEWADAPVPPVRDAANRPE